MKHIADWALNVAALRGASYADARLADDRSRGLATKNGKIGHAADSESLGIGVRVIADGAWGYAASDDLSRSAVEATAGRAVDIARASSRVKQSQVRLAPEKAASAARTTPIQIAPCTTSVAQNLDLLLTLASELRAAQGGTLADTYENLCR